LIEPEYQRTLDYLYSFIDYERMHAPRAAENYDLRRMYELLEGIGDPHLAARTVHVAGTKGKGSTAAMIHSVLGKAGIRAGLYTSPHLHDVRERVRVGAELISGRELMRLTAEIRPVIEAVNCRATYGELTTFEVLTALAFAHFKAHQADWQVLEVGLGGRLDATNVIIPEVAVITAISRDHTDVLGEELGGIAAEKAGIIKPGRPVVSAPQVPEVMAVIDNFCRRLQAPLIRVGQDVTWKEISAGLEGQRLRVNGRRGSYELFIPLLGRHQQVNAAVAVAALEVLADVGVDIDAGSIARGFAEVRWPGRLQIILEAPLIIVDGAHNTDAAGRLNAGLREYFSLSPEGAPGSRRGAILVLGASVDKDAGALVDILAPLFDRVDILAPLFDRFIATGSKHPRAMTADAIREVFTARGIEAETAENVPAALRLAVDDTAKRLVCATGSLFVAGEAIEEVSTWPGYTGDPLPAEESG